MNKRKIELSDFYNIKYGSEPSISPDGTQVVYVRTTMAPQARTYTHCLCLADGKGGGIDLVPGATTPIFMNDSKTVLFLKGIDGKKQLCKVDIHTKEVTQITHWDYAISHYSLSPDNKKVCFMSKIPTGIPISDLTVRNITTFQYKSDGGPGFKDIYHKNCLYFLNLDDASTVQATPDDFAIEPAAWYAFMAPAWSHDSTKVAFACRVQDGYQRDRYPWLSDLYVIDAETLQLETITDGTGIHVKPIFSSDDKSVYLSCNFNEYLRATDLDMYEVNLETKAHTLLTPDMEATVEDFTVTDSCLGAPLLRPVVDGNNNQLYFIASHKATTNVMRLDLTSGERTNLNTQKRRMYGYTMDASCTKMAFVYSDFTNPTRIAVMDLTTGEETLLVDENKTFFDGIQLSTNPQSITYTTDDHFDIEGWFLPAYGAEPGKKYPTLLEIHGGPFTFYGYAFNFEFQLFAALGMNVIYCNPRGSKSYGQALTAAVMDSYSTHDYEDMMQFVDECLEQFPAIDGDKMGVTGGSYGGFMTNWIITQTNRFKFAMAQRSISNWMGMYGSSDMGYCSNDKMKLGRYLRRLDELLDMSPICYVKNVQTPLLLLHSERDMRCPIAQAELFYVALKEEKKEVEFLRFPLSSHGLSRNGIPALREIRLQNMIDFTKKHLERLQ